MSSLRSSGRTPVPNRRYSQDDYVLEYTQPKSHGYNGHNDSNNLNAHSMEESKEDPTARNSNGNANNDPYDNDDNDGNARNNNDDNVYDDDFDAQEPDPAMNNPPEEIIDESTPNNINDNVRNDPANDVNDIHESRLNRNNGQLAEQRNDLPTDIYNKEQHLRYLERTSKWNVAVDKIENAFTRFNKEELSLIQLLDEMTRAAAPLNKISINKRASSNNGNDRNTVERVRHLVSNSMLGSANNYLKSNGLYTPSIPEIQKKLSSETNTLENEIEKLDRIISHINLHGSVPNRKTFSHEEILNKIESCRGSTSDAHGVSVNMFKVIARRGNEHACKGLTKSIKLILEGKLDPRACKWLNTTREVTLRKKVPHEFRLIGITNAFLSIADALAISTANEALKSAASPNQFGLLADGITKAAVTAQIVLEDDAGMSPYYDGNRKPKQQLAILHCDIKDAFDGVSRSEIINLLQELKTNHIHYFTDRMGSATDLVFEIEGTQVVFTTHKGVPQGRSSSSLLFDAIYGTALKRGKVFDIGGVRIILIHDDFYAIGRPEDLFLVHTRFTNSIKTIGLYENENKREYFCFNDDVASAMDNLFPNITRCTLGINIGGIPVGTDEYRINEIKQKDDENTSRVLELIRDHEGSIETVYALEKYCISPTFNHIIRANELLVYNETLREHISINEKKVINAFMAAARKQTRLPNIKIEEEWCDYVETRNIFFRRSSLGGLGITSAIDTSPAALLGAYAAIGSQLASPSRDGGVGCKLLEQSRYAKAIRTCAEMVKIGWESWKQQEQNRNNKIDLINDSERLQLKDAIHNPIVSINTFIETACTVGKGAANMKKHENLKYCKMQRDLITVLQIHSIKNNLKETYRNVAIAGLQSSPECTMQEYQERNANLHEDLERLNPLANEWMKTVFRLDRRNANGAADEKAMAFLITLKAEMHTKELSIRNRVLRSEYRQCLLCSETVIHEGKHAWCCKHDHQSNTTRSTKLHADIKRNAEGNLRTSPAHAIGNFEPLLIQRGTLTDEGIARRRQGHNEISRGDTAVTIRGHTKDNLCIDYTVCDPYKLQNLQKQYHLDHPPTPHTVANEGEQTKLKRYKTIWKDADKIVDIMGFSTLGAWGPLATETLNTLFEDGPSWTSKRRRITEKHNFICGISSTIKFKVANAWLKWLKGERNIAAINPPNDTEGSADHMDDRIVGRDTNRNSDRGFAEEKENAVDKNNNNEDEIEYEREQIVDRIIRGEQIM
jgi:hypothetical protein